MQDSRQGESKQRARVNKVKLSLNKNWQRKNRENRQKQIHKQRKYNNTKTR